MMFRKKQSETELVEAEQYDGTFAHMNRLRLSYSMDITGSLFTPWLRVGNEGKRNVAKGDWVVTAENGARFLCKTDYFEATYEPWDAVFLRDLGLPKEGS